MLASSWSFPVVLLLAHNESNGVGNKAAGMARTMNGDIVRLQRFDARRVEAPEKNKLPGKDTVE